MIDAKSGPIGFRLLGGCLAALLTCAISAERCFAQNLTAEETIQLTHDASKLHGVGVVVGLQGTGDNSAGTRRALEQTKQLMDRKLFVHNDAISEAVLDGLENPMNVALAYVSVTESDQQGEPPQCTVSATSARSLAGGSLLPTPLILAIPPTSGGTQRVQGFAEGPIILDEARSPTSGRIDNGYRPAADSRRETTRRRDRVSIEHRELKMAALPRYRKPIAD